MADEIIKYHMKKGKIFPVLVGDKVTLKTIENDEFYKKYYEWLKHEDVIKGVGEENMTIEEIVEMHSEWRDDPSNLTLGIYDNTTGNPVGDINLKDSDEFEEGPEIAIMVGERGKGFGTEAMNLMMKYAFNIIKVNQVNLTVYKDNPAVRLYQKRGFQITEEKEDSDTGKEEYEMTLKRKDWKE